jgi:hypothetical protein
MIFCNYKSFGYTLYRFTSWIYYSEKMIDEKSGKLNRRGKTKFLMNYRTHKNHELLIFKNKTDKELIEKYITEKININ